MEIMVRLCVLKMINQNIIEEKQYAVIAYGLELLFSSVVNILSILFISVILNRAGEIILLLLVSIPLQSFGGGYHCNTHLKCWAMTTVGYLIAVLEAVYLPVEVLLGTALIGMYPFFKFSPVENIKAPFGEKFKNKMKRTVRIVYFIGIIISLMLLLFKSEGAQFVLAAISLEGFSVLCAKYKQSREKE